METKTLLNSVATAMHLGVKPSTLASWRAKGLGPAWVRVGSKLVKYRADALEAYLLAASCGCTTLAETGVAHSHLEGKE